MRLAAHLHAAALAVATLAAAPAIADTAAPVAIAPGAPAPAAPILPGAGETLRRLPAVADGWTLSGEIDTVVWPLYLDGAAVARGGRLVFGIETAVSVMPEASTLVVQVNGRTVGQVALGGGDARRLVSLPIPPAALSAGWNAVRVTADQRHRVDCSVDGTYELWTRIDPAVTGFVAEGVRPVAGLDGLPALALDEDGRLPIRIRRGGALDTRALEPAVAIAGALARAAATRAPVVTVAAEPGTGPGIDVVAGDADDLAGLGFDPGRFGAGDPRVVVGPDGRPTLVVRTGSPDETAQAIRRIAEASSPPAAIDRVVRLDGASERSVTLAELGERNEQFSGRLWSRSYRIALPTDAVTADYGSVMLRLDAGYAPDLDPDDELSVFVDGRLVATVPFGKRSGEVTQDRRVELPLSAFRPGLNTLRIEARLVAPEDVDCDPHRQIAGNPRFLILASTRFVVPRLARMARLPDLGATVGAGGTGARAGEPVRIALAGADPATVGAAATLYVRMAVSGADLPDLELLPLRDADVRPGTVVIGAAGDVGPATFRRTGLEPPAEGHGWRTGAPRADTLVTGAVNGEDAPLLDAWRSRVRTGDGYLDRLSAKVADYARALRDAVGLGEPPGAYAVPETARLVLAQALPEGADAPVTLVSAPDPATLAAAVDRLAEPDRWSGLAGRVSLLDSTGGLVAVAAEETRFVSTGPMDVGNVRLVASAWLSANTAIYGMLLLGAGCMFGLATFAKVKRSGVRSK